ncbi:sugar ABC transporter permease [Fervidobacterium riparium]|uniref:Carbohydrate ABC transporter membrane protein 1, CUT1 family (TC 3.A.1.1.-) n=1 Tax=Fervidobacterium gondwanense DSM 13020 TaxID=1121883 RepID=A0A1M7S3J0_FERGO|nr:sugar ABC transporter permease [Fervidobacterium gondwanense]SHN53229.1 carbohydrate ABC transporter membrane protein 1, CUT1 family (TC 3.A.1.1.-) [Fervidobacterium gondwanense DSM 13020]
MRISRSARKAIAGYVYIMPWIIGFLLFTAFPFFYSLYLSFFHVNFTVSGIETEYVGWKYYIYAFRNDTAFPLNFSNTIINIVLSTPLVVIFALIVAILLNRKLHARTFFRLLYFLPVVIISGPVISELVTNNAASIVDPRRYFIYRFFLMIPNTISYPFLYMFNNLVLILWFSGVQILFFLAGLQKISSSIYEAAQIDGANDWVIFWKITLPLVRPFVIVNTIYTIVDLASFANNPVNTSITQHMFDIDKPYSYSSALSWIYFAAVMGILGVAYMLLHERRKKKI